MLCSPRLLLEPELTHPSWWYGGRDLTSAQDKGRRAFAGMMSALDDALRSIVDTLKETNMYNDLIVLG